MKGAIPFGLPETTFICSTNQNHAKTKMNTTTKMYHGNQGLCQNHHCPSLSSKKNGKIHKDSECLVFFFFFYNI